MRRAVLLLSVLGLHSPVMAAEAFKNGQPCMDGLCIGDGLAEVAKLKWDPAVVHVPFEPKVPITTLKVTDQRRAQIERIYRGDLGKAMPFLAGSSFDQTAVPVLRGLAVCEHRGGIAGTFTGKDGNPVKVGLTLLPEPGDPKVQRWMVTNFERHYLKAKTIEQQDAIRAQMDVLYEAAIKTDVPRGQGMYHMSGDRVYLTMKVGREGYAALKQHPLCATTIAEPPISPLPR